MPTHITARFTPEELRGATLAAPFDWTKGVPLLKVPVIERSPMYHNYGPGCLLENETRLYDLVADPGQQVPLADAGRRGSGWSRRWRALMRATDAPPRPSTVSASTGR